MHLRLDGQVYFYRWLFCDALKPRGCISLLVWPLRGINKTAWGTKLILTADLVYHSNCASLGHLLMAQHCHFCSNVCFEGINKTAWGAKLILMADLVYHLSCASLGHLLIAQHCHLSLNVCFSPPKASHLPPLSTPCRLNPRYYRHRKTTWGI